MVLVTMIDYLAIFLTDLLYLTTAVSLSILILFKWRYRYWKKKNVPYLEPTIPLGNVGNVLVEQRDENIAKMYLLAKSKGWKYCGLYLLLTPAILIVDSDLIKRVMATDFQYFTERAMYVNEKDDPAGCNLFTLTTERWRKLRAKLTPTFTSGKIKAMFQTLLDCGLALDQYLDENTGGNDPVDIKSVMDSYSTDVIGSCAFGVDCNSFKDPNCPAKQCVNKFFYASKWDYVTWLLVDTFPRLSRMLGVRQVKKDIGDFFVEMVHDTVSHRERSGSKRKDFMQLLIDLKNGKDFSTTLTINEIIGHTFIFFVAGSESSSSTLTFALFELAIRPNIQDRVRREVLTVLARHGGKMTYDAMNEMKYLEQVVEETLRLYPPSRVMERKCVADYRIPGEDVVIDKGTVVFISAKGVQYDEEFWPDPTQFDPDRFGDNKKKSMNHFSYLAFGNGPRGCLGERFGRLQVKVGLASVLRKFWVILNERTKLPLTMSNSNLFSEAEGSIWLNLERV